METSSLAGYQWEDVARLIELLTTTTNDAAEAVAAVEMARRDVARLETDLELAKAAALWGVDGKNETERKANAARAIARDAECQVRTAALRYAEDRLAELEASYKPLAMRAGALRSVADLIAAWLNSLR